MQIKEIASDTLNFILETSKFLAPVVMAWTLNKIRKVMLLTHMSRIFPVL